MTALLAHRNNNAVTKSLLLRGNPLFFLKNFLEFSVKFFSSFSNLQHFR